MKRNQILFSYDYDVHYEHRTATLTLCLVKNAQNEFYLASLEDETIERLSRIDIVKQIDRMSDGNVMYNIVCEKVNANSQEALIQSIDQSGMFEFKEEILEVYKALIEFVKSMQF